jgi:PhnB protein
MAELKWVTPHIVVRDAAAASEWYQRALGAEERGRVPVPGGKFMQIELRFGEHLRDVPADEINAAAAAMFGP